MGLVSIINNTDQGQGTAQFIKKPQDGGTIPGLSLGRRLNGYKVAYTLTGEVYGLPFSKGRRVV